MSFDIKTLMTPKALPDRTENISLVQTHISFVIVADDFVYKIKKPVDFGFLDFSTLDKREYYCNQEVDLNRRLSQDLYIGVLPVIFDGESYKIGGEGRGEIIEYTVKMKRIPDEMLMKSLFEKGTLKNDHLKEIARVLAEFHQSAGRSDEIDKFGDPEMFKINSDENFQQTEKYIDITIREEDYEAIKNWTDRFYVKNRSLFLDRVKTGKIRDCHGDLHMEHICLTDPVHVFDCIEFNDRFRYTDVLADIAFLLMDLEYHGGEDAADKIWKSYTALTDDISLDSLLIFYKVYRAYVRGKVNSFQIDDDQISKEKKEEAVEAAKKYFLLARRYLNTDIL